MEPWKLDVHPIYGAIYKDGEYVQRGAILGLSADAHGVVTAPVSGWVRLIRASSGASTPEFGLEIEIWPQRDHPAVHSSPPAEKPV